MSDDLILYTNPMSRGRIARWMLEEVGAPYRTEIMDFGGGGPVREALKAVNPMAKVPTIVHKGVVVTECAAICAYLADAFPDAELKPAGAALGDYYRWLFFAAGPVEAAVTDKSLGVVVPEDKSGMVGYGSFERMLDTLESAVADKAFVAGDGFSAADVYVGSQIAWGLMFGSIEARPAFRSYAEGLQARPGYKRAAALDDAAMPKQE